MGARSEKHSGPNVKANVENRENLDSQSDGAAQSRFGQIGEAKARLSSLIGRRPWTTAAIVGLSALAGLAEAGVLALIAHIATAMSTVGNRTFAIGPLALTAPISLLLVAAGVLAVVRLLLQIVLAHLPARLTGEVQTLLRTQLLNGFLMSSWAQKSLETEGHLQELMGGQTVYASNAIFYLVSGFSTALLLVTLAIAAFVLSAPASLAIVAIAVVLFTCLRPLSRQVRRGAAATSAALMSQASGVSESVRMAEEIEVFGTRTAERSRILALVESVEEHFVRTRTLGRVLPVLYQGIVIGLIVACLAVLYVVGIAAAELAALGTVVLMLVRASSYGQQIQTSYQGIQEALPYLERLTDTVARYQSAVIQVGRRPIGSIRTLQFDSVSFAYQPNSSILREVNFSIASGEAIGIVGPSGAGKSTLLHLLLRLRNPDSGNYLVNGIPAEEIDDDAWRRQVAYLPQDPHLLGGSVAENIRFFRGWIDDDAIERAARLAHIDQDIMTWSAGYTTIIGQRADAVSGGQRQRICLARALAGTPELLILDEPTSSLDLRSEKLIQDSLGELRGGLTLLVVAHRLSTLSLCDRVMVIRDGRVEAFATPDTLYRTNDFYREAVNIGAAAMNS